MERKLAAIFSADVKGYSRLMGEDEAATIRTLTTYREVLATFIQQHRGRVVDSPGDNLLAEFPSVVEAVQCAVAIQRELKARNAELPPQRRMKFRIGINLGDVVVEGERIYGDGVNIAARLEGLAEAGGICISGTVYEQVGTKLALGYEDLGEQAVKNIARPVRVYRVRPGPAPAASPVSQQEEGTAAGAEEAAPKPRDATGWVLRLPQRQGTLALVGLLLLLGGLLAGWWLYVVERAPRLALPDKPSIAVLPLANLNGDPAQDYFSDGMTEVLITDLSKVPALFVVARNSVFTYKGKAVEVGKVGKELGVRYVLEGSVLKAGDKVRITAQLVDATTAYHLWSERYDRDLQDIFALQDELTRKILLALRVKLTPEEQERFRHAPTTNLEAYDAYLRGRESYWRMTAEANAEARQLFERAISLDPQYAAAYAALSDSHMMDWLNGAPHQSLEQIFALAQKAVELDDSLPLAHSALGYGYMRKGQHDLAITEAERALALDPNSADGHFVLAELLNRAGRPQEAIGLLEKAMRLNPAYPAHYLFILGLAYHVAGRYEEAIAAAKRALARNPNLSFSADTHDLLAWSYSELGREREARAAVGERLKLFPNWSLEVITLKSPYKDPTITERRVAALHKAGVPWRWPTDNREALGHVGSGLEYLLRYTAEGNAQAQRSFAQAIALDPQYAAAYAFLGGTYLYEWIFQWSEDPMSLERAFDLTQQAIALDASVPLVHRVLGYVYLWKKQHSQALVEVERWIALDPHEPDAYARLAELLNYAGQPEKALGLVEKAMRLNPQKPGWYSGVLGWTDQLLGRYEKAIVPLQKAISQAPQHQGFRALLAISYTEVGREEEARAEAAELLRLNPDYSVEVDRQRLPYKDSAVLDRHLDALRKAGLK